MPKVPRNEMLRNGRIETFVNSPLWERFEGGRWRRYRQVRMVTRAAKDGLIEGGYADGLDWHWTGSHSTEEDARRALFDLVEAYTNERDAKAKAEMMARLLAEPRTARGHVAFDPGDYEEKVPFTAEELADWREPIDPITDEERAEWAEFKAEMREWAKDDWTPVTPPLDFPPLPEAGHEPK